MLGGGGVAGVPYRLSRGGVNGGAASAALLASAVLGHSSDGPPGGLTGSAGGPLAGLPLDGGPLAPPA